MITHDTRRESYKNLNRETIYKHIISALHCAGKPLTARQIAEHLHASHVIPYPVRQATAPRLTELASLGVIKATSKVYDKQTKRHVAMYELVEVGHE